MLVVAFRLWLSGFQPVSREPVAVWVPPRGRAALSCERDRPFMHCSSAIERLLAEAFAKEAAARSQRQDGHQAISQGAALPEIPTERL
jgi:hypothetical protein